MKSLVAKLLAMFAAAAARLPWCVLYAISTFVYFVLCHGIGYRRKVVMKNLRESFPEKSEQEIKKIAREFYRNFADMIVETVKLLHVSDEEMRARFTFEGVEIIDGFMKQGRSVAAYFSHTFNWEWAPSVTLWSALAPDRDAAFCQVYRPLRDKAMDALMLRIRGRFGARSLPKKNTLRALLALRRDKMPSVTGFMSDQKPSHGDPAYITTFLSHPTAFITGTETLARRLGMAAVYWDIARVGRGRYHLTVRPLSGDVASTEPMAVTAEYVRLLEATIRRDPANWLWSHKRWKIPVTLPENDKA